MNLSPTFYSPYIPTGTIICKISLRFNCENLMTSCSAGRCVYISNGSQLFDSNPTISMFKEHSGITYLTRE